MVIVLLLLMGLVFIIAVGSLFKRNDGLLESTFADNRIGLVRIEDMIIDSERPVRQIRKWADDKSIKAIVVRIESPGGGVAPSQEIHRAVKGAREKKPVVASMGALAASGGYYIAVATQRIVAAPGTLTGSIGVIVMFSNFQKLMDKLGLGWVTLTSGKFKDTGSPYRTFTDDDRKLMQGIVDVIYLQFITDVAEGRKMDIEQVRKLADGRIYTGRQALELKLVDELGGLRDAARVAARLAGIDKEPELVEEEKEKGLLQWLLGEDFKTSFINRARLASGVYFLWPAW